MKKVITRVLVAGLAAPALALGPAAIAMADVAGAHDDAAGHGTGDFCAASSPGYGRDHSDCGNGGGRPYPDTRPVINVHVHNHLDVDNTNANDLDNTQVEAQDQTQDAGHEVTAEQVRG
ncbi:hypothetical protein KIK06_04285 [Nocardiopsis sp. EMB25]|uniref:hypothetical protein n=1 Tax=Nocardiopsis TaxID=2013 RepID=UPI0003451D8E|nr:MULTISPECIES: hypothetical protein [Nocardiopsis]MCY9783108.1 hypothetical protein [Nocardiopsis sp. EMB25]